MAIVLPLQPAGPTQPQLRAEEEAPRVIAGAKPPTLKAVVELKPKILLTQNLSRPDMISWERSMRSYFKASNFELFSNDVQVCYLEERMDPASQQLLRKLCNGEPEKYGMENLYKMIREYMCPDRLTPAETHHPDTKLPTTPRKGFLTDIVQVRRD